MTQKHTPGPWRAGPRYNSIVADGLTGFDQEDEVDAYCGHLICESVKWDANARIIAAAPDILEALREFLDDENWMLGRKFDPNSGNFDLSKARAAIAKAEGRSMTTDAKPAVWVYLGLALPSREDAEALRDHMAAEINPSYADHPIRRFVEAPE